MNEIKVVLIGYGGIARAHHKGYRMLADEGERVRLVAVCDVDPTRFATEMKINVDTGKEGLTGEIHTYTNVDELIEKEAFDMADICLPTYLHKEYAVKLMQAGKHVLSEKPMALNLSDCDEMLRVSQETGMHLMIGQCLRFDAAYLYAKQCIDSGIYGKVQHVFMHRLCALPRWGFEHWFEDHKRSGGCLLDTHIHDVDMARFWFGEPNAASTVSLDCEMRYQVQNTRLYYPNMLVSIDGSWNEANTAKFSSGFRIRFEKATLLMDRNGITVYPMEGSPFSPELPQINHMTEEIRAFCAVIRGAQNLKNPPESARNTVALMERLFESAAHDGEIVKLKNA